MWTDVLGRLQIVREYLAAFHMATGVKLWVAEPDERCTNESPGSECFLAGFSCLREPIVIAGKHVATFASECFVVQGDSRRAGGEGNDEVHPHLNEAQFHGFTHLLGVFAQHISVFANRYLIAAQRQDPPWLVRAKELVQMKFAEPVATGEVARQINLSSATFAREFKTSTGMSFRDYVARVRVEQATRLLANPTTPLAEVAYSAGFRSVISLGRAFRQHTGVSPTAFRASLQFRDPERNTEPSGGAEQRSPDLSFAKDAVGPQPIHAERQDVGLGRDG